MYYAFDVVIVITSVMALLIGCRYVFDGLTEVQAETLLRNHGSPGSYLLSQYDDYNNYRLSFIAA